MKKVLVVSLLLAFIVTAGAYAHKGEAHSYMGTISSVRDEGFTITTKDGTEHRFKTSKDTIYTHSDNHAANRTELKAGLRAVVKIAKDGETATSVKFATKAEK